MLNNANNMKLDLVEKININDNVFVGHGSTVLPNITIGSNVIIAAGAMLNKDVADGLIVRGAPTKPIGRTEDLANRVKDKTKQLPWAKIIKNRAGSFARALNMNLSQYGLNISIQMANFLHNPYISWDNYHVCYFFNMKVVRIYEK